MVLDVSGRDDEHAGALDMLAAMGRLVAIQDIDRVVVIPVEPTSQGNAEECSHLHYPAVQALANGGMLIVLEGLDDGEDLVGKRQYEGRVEVVVEVRDGVVGRGSRQIGEGKGRWFMKEGSLSRGLKVLDVDGHGHRADDGQSTE